jgi:hypothetical protein
MMKSRGYLVIMAIVIDAYFEREIYLAKLSGK